MKLKFLIDEDLLNYKYCSMFIGFPTCTFKCEKECGEKCCQNSQLVKAATFDISSKNVVERYINNPLSRALVIGGLEPMDSKEDLIELVDLFRESTDDVIVIYTGYYEDEVEEILNQLKKYKNIIVKFGRYVPKRHNHYDSVLGVYLPSENQYAKVIS